MALQKPVMTEERSTESLRLRPLTLPENMVDYLYFQANRNGITSQELLLKLIKAELDQRQSPLSGNFDLSGPSVKLFGKLPPGLDEALVARAKELSKSPNFIIFQALAREFAGSKKAWT